LLVLSLEPGIIVIVHCSALATLVTIRVQRIHNAKTVIIIDIDMILNISNFDYNSNSNLYRFNDPISSVHNYILCNLTRVAAIQHKQPVKKIEQIIKNINNNLGKAENL